MTVAELIEKLKAMPQEADFRRSCPHCGAKQLQIVITSIKSEPVMGAVTVLPPLDNHG